MKEGLDIPEEVEGQFFGFILAGHFITLPSGLPQLICEGELQLVLPDVLLNLVQLVQEVHVRTWPGGKLVQQQLLLHT